MPDDVMTLQDRRRELLRRRISESGLTAAQSVMRVRVGERHPLSAGQRRMWFLQTRDPADATLNICVAYRLTGALDEGRFRGAVDDVIGRHGTLRTIYGVDSHGDPYQIIHDDVEICWRVVDLVGSNTSIEEVARQEFGTPFDLANDPPLRVTLVHVGAHEYVLLLVVHHISWDDDCFGLFFSEVSAAYHGRGPLAPAVQFVDVADVSAAEPAEEDLAYWRDALRRLPEPVELPGSPVSKPTKQARRRSQVMPAELLHRAETFARERSATPFMLLLATFGALIRRYTGASEFLVSVPVTDRAASADKSIGYFGNTLLIRITARPGDTFASLVSAVRHTCLDGFAHQSVGIDRVVREANPARTMGRDGMEQLVGLGFSMRKSANTLALDGVEVQQLELGAVTAQLPLTLTVDYSHDGADVEFEYQSDLLEDVLVGQMLAHYLRLLDSGLTAPHDRLGSLTILGADERDAIVAQSHGDLVDTPATTMVAVLEAAAAGRPDAVALTSDEAEFTYAELHRRSNRLARWLIGEGIGAEDIVGLRMTTSIEFIVALLAVLKAGAAYLPVDPAYPQDRIDYLIADASPMTVIARTEFDAAEEAAAALSDAALTDADRRQPLRPQHLAYVIYTSGSTGRPKGVAVSHRAIAEHVECFAAEWSMTADDRLLQSSSVSFDASLLDIFVTLALGARLIVPKPDAFADLSYVADLIDRHHVTVLHMVPSMLSTVLLLPQAAQWRQLRHVPVGGEALSAEVVDKFSDYFDARLRNHYGPTEAVVCSTHMDIEGPQARGVVPIGVPNRNVYTYVLDNDLQPVPAEVVGELYLGGAQLARGYLGRPGLTAQRFVADPFTAGMRLYRTGDLVRRNLSGHLEFVGRSDEQVKVRGFRIELGEVESVLAAHPSVRHSVVVADDTEIGTILVGYVVPDRDAGGDVDLDDVRAHAASVLPDYMVPSAFCTIDDIPLTISGKLDKRALPAPTAVAVRSHREPATESEQRMCAIFATLFACDRVGADDSFFELGGHSLLAARLVALIRAQFGVDCTARAVFDAPTPAGLAVRLLGEPRTAARPPLLQATRPARPPLSYSQLAMWFQHRLRGANDVFNLALSLRIDGRLDLVALGAAIDDVVARHEALRTTFAEHDGVPHQMVHPVMEVALEVTESTAVRVDEDILELRRHVFALDEGPMIKPTVLKLGSDSHVLLLLIHHIVCDHVSLGVIFEDLVDAYRARTNGAAPHWDPLPLQFIDHALWQHGAFDATSDWGDAELAYWRQALEGLPDEIPMGADCARPPVLGTRAEVVSFGVPAERRAAITRLAEQIGTSEFMVYQATLAVVLHKLGGGVDIPVGSPVSARVDVATERVAGPFANVVVLRNDLSGDPSLRTVITRSRGIVLDALAHQELPIDRLVEAINPRRSTSRNHPLFQCSIHFRGEDWAHTARALTDDTTVT
ncbi:non-ribosomal peptide synthetase, partial [Mycobacteriaceae bacterium 1482268.1]